jgi:hypothetical protein
MGGPMTRTKSNITRIVLDGISDTSDVIADGGS